MVLLILSDQKYASSTAPIIVLFIYVIIPLILEKSKKSYHEQSVLRNPGSLFVFLPFNLFGAFYAKPVYKFQFFFHIHISNHPNYLNTCSLIDIYELGGMVFFCAHKIQGVDASVMNGNYGLISIFIMMMRYVM